MRAASVQYIALALSTLMENDDSVDHKTDVASYSACECSVTEEVLVHADGTFYDPSAADAFLQLNQFFSNR